MPTKAELYAQMAEKVTTPVSYTHLAQHKLVIAEKPSVAQSLAAVIGATVRKDGYLAVSYTHLDVYKRQGRRSTAV